MDQLKIVHKVGDYDVDGLSICSLCVPRIEKDAQRFKRKKEWTQESWKNDKETTTGRTGLAVLRAARKRGREGEESEEQSRAKRSREDVEDDSVGYRGFVVFVCFFLIIYKCWKFSRGASCPLQKCFP